MQKEFKGKHLGFSVHDFPEAETIVFCTGENEKIVLCDYKDLTRLVNWLTILESQLLYKNIKTTEDL